MTSDMVQQMTDEEKEKYKQVYQQALSHAEYYWFLSALCYVN